MDKLIINKEEVKQVDISKFKDWVSPNDVSSIDKPAGHTAWHLFAYLVSKINYSTICEIGCRWGSSSRVLSSNDTNRVDAYDIDNDCIKHCKQYNNRPNVDFYCENILADMAQLLEHKIIFLDITPHSGKEENDIYNYLVENNWDGILILDDIGPEWQEMVTWWNNLPNDPPKYDVTDIGHHAGMGIIDFSRKIEII